MERYLDYILNIIADSRDMPLQPVYGIRREARLEESIAPHLAGYRGMGPARVGNQAYSQVQNDVFGSAILAGTHAFFTMRLERPSDARVFADLERLGEQAVQSYRLPDAGIWELRGVRRVHTFSSMMCWAACDRLASIALRLGRTGRGAILERSRRHDSCGDLRGRVPCLSKCWRNGIISACWPKTWCRRPASNGGIFRRLTAWWG